MAAMISKPPGLEEPGESTLLLETSLSKEHTLWLLPLFSVTIVAQPIRHRQRFALTVGNLCKFLRQNQSAVPLLSTHKRNARGHSCSSAIAFLHSWVRE